MRLTVVTGVVMGTTGVVTGTTGVVPGTDGVVPGAAGHLPSESAHRSATPTATRRARWIEPLGAICSMLEVCAL